MNRTHSRRPKRQAGFIMLETSLSLLVALAAAFLTYWSSHRADLATQAMTQADNLASVAKAADTLVTAHYDDYQAGLPVTQNGVTLAFGTDDGQSMKPTIANLRAMGLGLTAGSDFGNYKSLGDATYVTTIQRSPAGCEASANGKDCNVSGMVCMNMPVRDLSAPAGEIDGFGLGKMIGKLGGDGGASILGSQANITGAGGAWTATNPVAGAPAGIICARFGFGSSAFMNFLRVRDSRDPDFQGTFTVAGVSNFNSTVNILGAPVNVVDTLSGCIRAGMTPGDAAQGGTAFTKNAACAQTILLEGQTGIVSASGAVQVKDAGGNVLASLNADGTVVATTRSIAPTSKLTASYTPNTACGAPFANDIAQNLSSPGLVVCRNNIWTPIGLPIGALGGACTVEGAAGVATNGLGLFCQGAMWIANADRMGHFASQDSFVGHHNTTANKPGCASNGVPRIYFSATGGEFSPVAGVRSTYFVTQDTGAQWLLKVIDANGVAVPDGQGVVTTGCWYS